MLASSLRRALVIKLRHHGDVLLATPVLASLREAAPRCEIDALVYAETAPMMEQHPALAQLHTIDRNWKRLGIVRQAHTEWRLLSALRARRYDLVVHLTDHPRGAWLTRLIRPRWAVAPERKESLWKRSFSHLSPPPKAGRHTVEANLDSLRTLGIEPRDKRVTLTPGAAAEMKIASVLTGHGLAERGFIHVHPASRWLFKCWPAEKVAVLCMQLRARGWPVVLTAAPDPREIGLIEAVKSAMPAVPPTPTMCAPPTPSPALAGGETSCVAVPPTPTVVDLAGQLSLKELAALTARARLFVGVDSAPMHIAAAMGTPTVAIFGPSGDQEWGPWNVVNRIVTSTNHPCRPCGRDGCEGSKVSACLTELPVEAVRAACEELLAEREPT